MRRFLVDVCVDEMRRYRSKIVCKKYGVDLIKFGGMGEDEAVVASLNGWDDTIRLISIEKNSYVRYYKGHREQVRSMERSPVMKEIFVTSSDDCSIKLWDFRTSSCQATISQSTPSRISFDPLGVVIASVRRSGLNEGKGDFLFNSHLHNNIHLHTHHHDDHLLQPSHIKRNYEGLSLEKKRRREERRIDLFDSRMLDYGPFSSWLMPNDDNEEEEEDDNHAFGLNEEGRKKREVEESKVSMSQEKNHQSSFPSNSSLLFELGGEKTGREEMKDASIVFSPDGNYLLISSSSSSIYLIDAFTGTRIHHWKNREVLNEGIGTIGSTGSIGSIGSIGSVGSTIGSFSSQSSHSSSSNSSSFPSSRLVSHSSPSSPPPLHLISASFSPDGSLIASGSTNGNIHFYDPISGVQVSLLSGDDSQPVKMVHFHPLFPSPAPILFASSGCSLNVFSSSSPSSSSFPSHQTSPHSVPSPLHVNTNY